jgi:hypothetical protein
MNLNKLEHLAKAVIARQQEEEVMLGTEDEVIAYEAAGCGSPETVLHMIELVREMGEALEYLTKPLCMCFAGCPECDESNSPNIGKIFAAYKEMTK